MQYRFIVLLVFVCCFACRRGEVGQVYPALNALVDSVRLQYAADARDDVFEISVVERGGRPVAKGFTSVAEAKVDLLARLGDAGVADSIVTLPDETVGDAVFGVVNVSVADMRTGADYAAEMATQLLLGAPVRMLQHDGWWRVKSAEGYVAWLTGDAIVRMTPKEFNDWTAAPKIIFTNEYGFAYAGADDGGQRASDLVFGNMLKLEGETGKYFKASYPDGRRACVLKSQSKTLEDWLSSLSLTEESITGKAKTLMGIPYSWGGTSVKMMDCSGFAKTVYLMHGLILRRDASQQAKTGIPVALTDNYENLRPGDLMFFGRKAQDGKKERIRHVGIYLGDKKFIHEAGNVHISSLDPESPDYDERNTREFVRASRVIGAVNTEGIWEIARNPLYQTHIYND
jgi:cell wall-associated NlpC family hydrolase